MGKLKLSVTFLSCRAAVATRSRTWLRKCAGRPTTYRPEEVHAALVDAQDQLRRQQADGVLNALDVEEYAVA